MAVHKLRKFGGPSVAKLKINPCLTYKQKIREEKHD